MSGRHRKEREPALGLGLGWMAVGAGMVAIYLHYPKPVAVAAEPVMASAPSPVTAWKTAPKVVAVAKVTHRIPPLEGGAGLVPNAKALAAYIQATYPDVKSIGGVRPCDVFMEHCRGVALDIMVADTSLGDRIDRDLMAQADRFNIRYTLWKQQQRNPSGQVRWMGNRGTPTANHFDHLHIRVAA